MFNTTGFARNDVVTLPGVEAEALADETGRTYPVQQTADGAVVYLENLPAKGRRGFAKAAAQAVEAPFALSADGHTLEDPLLQPSVSTKTARSRPCSTRTPAARCSRQARPATPCACLRTSPSTTITGYRQLLHREVLDVTDVKDFTWTENGPVRATLHIERSFSKSTICQISTSHANLRRVDFVTTVDWKEHQHLLKVFFPADVHTDQATFEIQYGNLTRKTHSNTSWDRARFESCGQKWCDVSEGHYGVSVLNDCKYGHSVKDGCIGLTLIKSGIEPNPVTDQEVHTFTYALYPHQEGWQAGGTVPQAYFLNQPALAVAGGSADAGVSLAGVDVPNVVLETVKQRRGRRRRDPAPVRVRERQDPGHPDLEQAVRRRRGRQLHRGKDRRCGSQRQTRCALPSSPTRSRPSASAERPAPQMHSGLTPCAWPGGVWTA